MSRISRIEPISGRADIHGFSMHYEIEGDGPPAIYIHPAWGIAGIVALPPGPRWISPDLRGHGRSTGLERPMSFELAADDVAALVRHLKIDEVDVFGNSVGGCVAIELALRHPELVRRVVTYGTAYRDIAQAHRPEIAPAPAEPDHAAFTFQRTLYESVAPDGSRWPVLFQRVRAARDSRRLSDQDLRSLRAPVLVATGDHDWIRIEHCVEVASLIPTARLAVIPDAGRFVLDDAPEKLLPVISSFLDADLPGLPFATRISCFQPGVNR